ncbi:MAG TPA: hypothetical protein VFX59_15485, partial [Polyangiales bacterium]|nr:hypothetical protein [Polyangiales bacterium]
SRAALAELRVLQGDLERAQAFIDEAHRVEADYPPSLATVYVAHAKLELARGRPELALAEIERAVALIDEHGDAIDSAGRVYALQLDCLVACGRSEEALRASLRANVWLERQLAPISDPSVRTAYVQLGENQRIRAR